MKNRIKEANQESFKLLTSLLHSKELWILLGMAIMIVAEVAIAINVATVVNTNIVWITSFTLLPIAITAQIIYIVILTNKYHQEKS